VTIECTPRYATPLTPGRKNQRRAAEKIAHHLGFELLPWQSNAIALWTEQEDGHYCYPDATLLVSRQSGKSTMLLVYLLVRALGTPDTHTMYGAQTLKDSRAMLLEVWEPMLAKSPLAGAYTARSANGSERIRFANGSTITLLTTRARRPDTAPSAMSTFRTRRSLWSTAGRRTLCARPWPPEATTAAGHRCSSSRRQERPSVTVPLAEG